jgi:hypothetical protein
MPWRRSAAAITKHRDLLVISQIDMTSERQLGSEARLPAHAHAHSKTLKPYTLHPKP